MNDGLMFFSSCNIRAFYPRENKPRLTLATVYKIRKRNYLYEYICPGQYKPRLEKDVNVDQILYHLYGVNIQVFCKPRPEEAAAYFLSYKWGYGPGPIRAVYTRENKPRLTQAAAYVNRERNYLYEYKLPGQDKPRLEKAVNVDFVPFIRGVRGLRKPRPELAAAYFLSYKRPYCD